MNENNDVFDVTPEEIEQIKLKARGRNKPPTKERKELQLQTAPGDNTASLLPHLKLYRLPRINLHDPVELQARVDEYFGICAEYDMKPTVAALALALHTDRVNVWRIAHGADGTDRTYLPECRNTIKDAYTIINGLMEHYMVNGKINPVSGIFLMKNNMGYSDRSELVVEPKQRTEDYSRDDIRNRYITESND